MLERGREAQDEEDRVGMRSVEKKIKIKEAGRTEKSEIQQREEQKNQEERKRETEVADGNIEVG